VTLDGDSLFTKLSSGEQDALLRGVDEIRAEHERSGERDAIFNRNRRIRCRDLILKNLPGLIEAIEDPAGRADIMDVFINDYSFSADVLLKRLRLLHHHHQNFEPWPERAYSASFDWEGNNDGGGERLSTERQRNAVVALVQLLDNHGVRVTSYVSNPGFALLRRLTGQVLGQELEAEKLRSLVKLIRKRRFG
jgi:hypothetical protein